MMWANQMTPIQIQHLIHRFRRFTQILEGRRLLFGSSDNLRKSACQAVGRRGDRRLAQSVDEISSESAAEIYL
jgi:hypothetical protein